jgi:hypothetical protein
MLLETLHILLGAALVALGVIAAAVADRIRGLRVNRPTTRREAIANADAIEVVAAPAVPKTRRQQYVDRDVGGGLIVGRTHVPFVRVATGESPLQVKMDQDASEVIAALVAAGYKKAIATEATWGCGAAERATIEVWVAAALRRCARGGAS